MKRVWAFLVVLLLVCSFFGCAKQETSFTVTKNGTQYHVNTQEMTVSDGFNTYPYEFSGDASSFRITIIYPNGASYWYSQSGGMGQGGWSEAYDETAYVSGDILVDVVREIAAERANPGRIAAGLFLTILGILDTAFPKLSWYLGYGWRYKNAEPSDAALIFSRVGGVIAIVIGIVFLLS